MTRHLTPTERDALVITNVTSLDALSAAVARYKAALLAGSIEDADLYALYNAMFDCSGCNELYDLAQDYAEPEADLFGHPINSLAARRTSAGWDEGKSFHIAAE